MKHSTSKLSIDDKVGFLLGMVIFVLTLPMPLLFAFLLKQLLFGFVTNTAVGTALGFVFLGMGAIFNLVFASIIGLMVSYLAFWGIRRLHLPSLVHWAFHHQSRPLETQRYTGLGAVIGGVLASVLFLLSGHAPLDIVVLKVGQLFPTPIIINFGANGSFDLIKTYAEVTGFLTVGGLFVVMGLGFGSLSAATIERLIHRQTV